MPNQRTSVNSSYGRRRQQIGKQDLYMLTALWMEQSPWATAKERVVGAVFVTPNDRVLSVDCSRGNDGGVVHGAIRALLQYPDQVQGCYVYLSRQPCAHCVKMLVQAAVKKVFYLPLKPEKDDVEENKSVDALFKVSPVSREVYVPNITKDDLKELSLAENPYGTLEAENLKRFVQKVEQGEWEEWNEWNEWKEWEEWKKDIVSKIGWEEYSDKEIKVQVDEDMKNFFNWFVQGILATGEKETMEWKEHVSTSNKEHARTSYKFNQEVANHLSRLAQMLSHRTDDPSTGIGCVIADENKEEILGIGWNGYPSEALYGNHPRGSTRDHEASQQKYPHIIYALENAVLFRNRRELGVSCTRERCAFQEPSRNGCVVYHTIVPSDDGIAMLYQLCAQPVLVLPSFDNDEEMEKKRLFKNGLQEKKLTVFNHIKKPDQNPEEGNPEDAGSG